jgi:hypothetical protein
MMPAVSAYRRSEAGLGISCGLDDSSFFLSLVENAGSIELPEGFLVGASLFTKRGMSSRAAPAHDK